MASLVFFKKNCIYNYGRPVKRHCSDLAEGNCWFFFYSFPTLPSVLTRISFSVSFRKHLFSKDRLVSLQPPLINIFHGKLTIWSSEFPFPLFVSMFYTVTFAKAFSTSSRLDLFFHRVIELPFLKMRRGQAFSFLGHVATVLRSLNRPPLLPPTVSLSPPPSK